jgi:hypothetical protein
VQEGLLISAKPVGQRSALALLPPALLNPADPLFSSTGISHSHVFPTGKQIDFPSRHKKQIQFQS